jgi:hypothetical protein
MCLNSLNLSAIGMIETDGRLFRSLVLTCTRLGPPSDVGLEGTFNTLADMGVVL